MKLVVDTNIIIAALIKDSACRHLLTHLNAELISIRFSGKEVQKYKKRIVKKTGMSDDDFDVLVEKLFEKITMLNDQLVELYMQQARKIMEKIDRGDTPFIAAALATKADIWSDDMHFEKQTRIKVWKTKDLIPFF